MDFTFRTIQGQSSAAFRDRGSKFLAYAFPVRTVDDIKAKLAHIKSEHPKATHHCYAYRLGTGKMIFRANDDGEPSGSAGKPILNQIDSAGLTDVLVVVVRYFGGTLLGVPGLIHAYKTAATEALQAAGVMEKWIETKRLIEFEYPVMNDVMNLLKRSEAFIYKQDLSLFCTLVAGIPMRYAEDCIQKLNGIKGVRVKDYVEEY